MSSNYPPETITRALLTLAKHAGDSEKAHADLLTQLPADEVPTSRTLRQWRNTQHRDEYTRLHDTYRAEIEAALVPEFRELAQAAAEASRLAVDKTTKALQAGSIKDPSGAARNLTITAATAMDKLYLATDRPTEVRTDNDARALLGELKHLLGEETQPIQDAEVIPPPALPAPRASS